MSYVILKVAFYSNWTGWMAWNIHNTWDAERVQRTIPCTWKYHALNISNMGNTNFDLVYYLCTLKLAWKDEVWYEKYNRYSWTGKGGTPRKEIKWINCLFDNEAFSNEIFDLNWTRKHLSNKILKCQFLIKQPCLLLQS